jgi:negative regulator of flagellin synthesis FlgM
MRIKSKAGGGDSSRGQSRPKPPNTPGSKAAAPAPVSEAIKVSSEAWLVAVAQETLAVVPDIRMEKMKAIKNQLDANTYNPDGEAVVEGLIKDNMANGRQH